MTRGWLSVALACALGAFVGTLAALDIAARFEYGSRFWGIGALLGVPRQRAAPLLPESVILVL